MTRLAVPLLDAALLNLEPPRDLAEAEAVRRALYEHEKNVQSGSFLVVLLSLTVSMLLFPAWTKFSGTGASGASLLFFGLISLGLLVHGFQLSLKLRRLEASTLTPATGFVVVAAFLGAIAMTVLENLSVLPLLLWALYWASTLSSNQTQLVTSPAYHHAIEMTRDFKFERRTHWFTWLVLVGFVVVGLLALFG